MKTAIVPAQITTVEDKVAGNLSMQQLVLLVAPLFFGGGLYALAPHIFQLDIYKIVLFASVAAVCAVAAIRIKGTLMIYWLIRLCKFYARPRLYLYRHSDVAHRPRLIEAKRTKQDVTQTQVERQKIQLSERIPTLDDSASISIKKGGFHVSYAKQK